ncbi:MAG: hypothetical protein WKH64_08530 [Chloroflexia bacterium]
MCFIVAPSVLLTVFSALVMGVMGTMLLVVIPAVLSIATAELEPSRLQSQTWSRDCAQGCRHWRSGCLRASDWGGDPCCYCRRCAGRDRPELSPRTDPESIAVAGRADGRVAPLPPAY